MLTIITLPETFIASTTAYIGELFTDVSTYVILIIGLPLAFWIIRKLISLLRQRA